MADNELNRYSRLIESIFSEKYRTGDTKVYFERSDLNIKAEELDIMLPKNLGDIIYSFKYRASLPESIIATAPKGKEWVIKEYWKSKILFYVSWLFSNNT